MHVRQFEGESPLSNLVAAAGGDFLSGQALLVGERGPELIVPRTGGTVIPNHALGGVSYTINGDINVGDGMTSSQVTRAFAVALKQVHKSAVTQAKAEIADERLRS